MRFHGFFLSIWLGTSCLTAADREGERLFALKVRGILNAKCLACHGEAGKKLKGDLDLSSRAAMLKGGESEEASLVPGKPLASPLYLAATREHEEDWSAMPPKENDKLTADQLAVLKRWIDLGSPWPDAKTQARYIAKERAKPVTAEGVLVKTSGGTSEDWTYRRYRPEDVWAFQPVVKPKVPQGAANPVDAFINRKLKVAGFARAPQAEFRTLVKRAYYDLTGLPPTPFEIFQFRQAWDKDPVQAWAALIDRLLASPHYGERWGQHWLDVARYADTGGYSNDYERSNMWRYRDYVIRAFNEDKPYDEFIREQIAGDELADASLRRRISDWNQFQNARQNGKLYNARESEQLVASSFLRMGPWDPAMVKKPQARQIYLDDVVNAVGETFLSTTMRCFKCHDHKFDPLPTRDYSACMQCSSPRSWPNGQRRFLKRKTAPASRKAKRPRAICFRSRPTSTTRSTTNRKAPRASGTRRPAPSISTKRRARNCPMRKSRSGTWVCRPRSRAAKKCDGRTNGSGSADWSGISLWRSRFTTGRCRTF